jgi:RNA polymerase sigma factor (sigma-70 family)
MFHSSPVAAFGASTKVQVNVVIERRPKNKSLQDEQLEALMRSAQDGDAGAYAELLGAITPRLRRIISNQRRFLQQADIEDLVQEVLLSLHAVRGTYDPERPFMPWLMAITHYRLADAARRYHRHAARQDEIEQLSVTFAEETPNIEAEAYGDQDALKQAIERLPARQREAIQLLKLRELSLREAAKASGASAGALRVSVHRAITTLRRTLKDNRYNKGIDLAVDQKSVRNTPESRSSRGRDGGHAWRA